MTRETCTEAEFISLWERFGSVIAVAKELGVAERNVHQRRRRIEERRGINLQAKPHRYTPHIPGPHVIQAQALAAARAEKYERWIDIKIPDGIVLIGSDAHYWPQVVTPAHQAFVRLCKALKPRAAILNGDILDGSRISRHDRIGWEDRPSLGDELKAVQDRLGEIHRALPPGSLRLRTPGNHCIRFESFLSKHASEMEGVMGSTLFDHIPEWRAGWAIRINGTVVVKHRFKGGIHATHNNTMWSGQSIVTGHLHSLKMTPFTDYNGTRYGVDTGTLAEISGPQFGYLEENPVNWRSGFAVLTFRGGMLLPPELCTVLDGIAYFRGDAV